MHDCNDFHTVVGGLINGDVIALDHKPDGIGDFGACWSHFRMTGNQVELFEQSSQKLVGCWLVVDRYVVPDLAQLLLRTGRKPVFTHDPRVPP